MALHKINLLLKQNDQQEKFDYYAGESFTLGYFACFK